MIPLSKKHESQGSGEQWSRDDIDPVTLATAITGYQGIFVDIHGYSFHIHGCKLDGGNTQIDR